MVDIINKRLFSFIESTPTPYQAVENIERRLLDAEFNELNESVRWILHPGKKYFVTRNGSIIAFTISNSKKLSDGFRMIGAHTDSPSLQIKPTLRKGTEPYMLLGVEKYGGPILHTWFDRELSLAGRVAVRVSAGGLKCFPVDFKRPVVFIPSLAIHLNRKINEGLEINVQDDLSPVISQCFDNSSLDFKSLLLAAITGNVPEETTVDDIIGFDLFCYDIGKCGYFGINNEFISAPRLDNLLSCFAGLETVAGASEATNAMLICSNHEEIGSQTESGALGSFLSDVLLRLYPSNEERIIGMRNSFLLSLDNAHATHPNFKEKSDPDHTVLLNRGPVIKLNASQRYSSTSLSAAEIRMIAIEADVICQDFVMRSDMVCGSTIGPLTSSQLGVTSVDIGAPTWGMHSVRETTGSKDPADLVKLAQAFIERG